MGMSYFSSMAVKKLAVCIIINQMSFISFVTVLKAKQKEILFFYPCALVHTFQKITPKNPIF